MDRRFFIAALAGCASCLPHAAPAQADAPRFKVSAAQLGGALAARFPMRLGVPGLAELDLARPELLLLPGRNRAGAALQALAAGNALGPLPPGRIELLFALRYEPRDRTLRAVQPELAQLDWPGLDAQAQQDLRLLAMQVLAPLEAQLVLHRFTAQELALPEAMGFTPGTLRVEDDGVVLVFEPAPGLWGGTGAGAQAR